MTSNTGRRQFIQAGVGILGVGALAAAKPQTTPGGGRTGRFRFGLNTGTIRGYQLGLVEQVEVAAAAGYDGVEPWLADISKYVAGGGSLRDLRQRCKDRGLEVYSAIGFAQWIVEDETQRAAGIEQMKRDMAMVAELGGVRIAAPPAGANRGGPKLDVTAMAERYRAVLDLGRETGVVPQLEIWGHSTNLSHLAEALSVAAHTGHPDACVLADVFHLYKGGTAPAALKFLSRRAAHVFHMNDYPATPDRTAITDAQRIWPGDGIAPLKELLGYLVANDCAVVLSLELFNAGYWKQPVGETARSGLTKMKAAASLVA